MDIEKRIDSLLNRFDNLVCLEWKDQDNTESQIADEAEGQTEDKSTVLTEGKAAHEKVANFLNYYPQNIAVLEKLYPGLTKVCPSGTKRALHQTLIHKTFDDAVVIGNDQYLDVEVLVVDLTLPESATESDRSAIESFANTFAKAQGDYGGVFLVQFN